MTEKTNRELEKFLRKLNQAWMNDRASEVRAMLHDDMVIVSSDFQVAATGGDACAQSYSDFTSRAKVTELKESEFSIQSWGDAAMASYRFEISWAMEGETHRDSGRDVYLLVRTGDCWQAAWRMMLPAE